MTAHVTEKNVWVTQNVFEATLVLQGSHLETHRKWKEVAKPAMTFFVTYLNKEYNENPRCALCGCNLGGPGAGHLQSRNHLNRLKKFLDPLRLGPTDRNAYWQVVRHRDGAARINHVDLEVQLCEREPPPFQRRLEELLSAGAFVQWELPPFKMVAANLAAHNKVSFDKDLKQACVLRASCSRSGSAQHCSRDVKVDGG